MNRRVLYEELCSTPMRQLAERYRVSDRSLARVCERLGVPVPRHGCRARDAAEQAAVSSPRLDDCRDPDSSSGLPVPELKELQDFESLRKARDMLLAERTEEREIRVPSELVDAHPLVAQTRAALEAAEPSAEGLVTGRSSDSLDVAVSRQSLPRALLILDTLVKALELRGHPVRVVGPRKARKTVAKVLDRALPFSLEEYLEVVQNTVRLGGKLYTWRSTGKARIVPTGRLVLRIDRDSQLDVRTSWTESKKLRLEDCLNQFVASAVKLAVDSRLSER